MLQLNLDYTLMEDSAIKVNAGLLADKNICFKFQGVFDCGNYLVRLA